MNLFTRGKVKIKQIKFDIANNNYITGYNFHKGIFFIKLLKEMRNMPDKTKRYDTFLKGKILAAIYDESFNHLMVRAIRKEIKHYEDVNGPLPKPATPSEK